MDFISNQGFYVRMYHYILKNLKCNHDWHIKETDHAFLFESYRYATLCDDLHLLILLLLFVVI